MYFTLGGRSWLNIVDDSFATDNRLRRGVFCCLQELIATIDGYIDHHNANPKPFTWTAKAADILEKVKSARAALYNRQHSA